MLALLAMMSLACDSESTPATGNAGSGGSTAGSAGASPSGGQAGQGGSAGAAPLPPGTQEVSGCQPEVKLLEPPASPAARGPWSVGVRTGTVQGLTTEIWYPAVPGSEQGQPTVEYDLRQWLPASEKGKIPDEDAPRQACGCHRDLPLDTARGPYPVIVFLHGTGGFRTQSLPHMEHWASRGFVVVAADYPGLYLADALEVKFKNEVSANTTALLDALATPTDALSFLAGHLDLTRTGLAGHSAGGNGLKNFGSRAGVRVLIPLAAGGTTPSPTLESTLIVGGLKDSVVPFDKQQQGYEASGGAIRRLVGIDNTGHLFPTDLCWLTNAKGKNIVQTAQEFGVTNADLASGLFDCPEGQLARDRTLEIVNSVTTAAFEEKLTCRPTTLFDALPFPEVTVFKTSAAP